MPDLISLTRLGALMLALLACSSREQAKREPWNDALKAELLQRIAKDQEVRDRVVAFMQTGAKPDSLAFAEMRAVDSANTAWMRDMVASHGWPDRSAVGEDGMGAAFLLVQHADLDTAFQAAMLPMITEAFRRGEAKGQSVALLTDRLAVARNQGQVYGSQATMDSGRVVFHPIADSANVDARRAEMGLPPLAEYRRVLDSVYFGRRTP